MLNKREIQILDDKIVKPGFSKDEKIDQVLVHVRFILNKLMELADLEQKNETHISRHFVIATYLMEKFADTMTNYKINKK